MGGVEEPLGTAGGRVDGYPMASSGRWGCPQVSDTRPRRGRGRWTAVQGRVPRAGGWGVGCGMRLSRLPLSTHLSSLGVGEAPEGGGWGSEKVPDVKV